MFVVWHFSSSVFICTSVRCDDSRTQRDAVDHSFCPWWPLTVPSAHTTEPYDIRGFELPSSAPRLRGVPALCGCCLSLPAPGVMASVMGAVWRRRWWNEPLGLFGTVAAITVLAEAIERRVTPVVERRAGWGGRFRITPKRLKE